MFQQQHQQQGQQRGMGVRPSPINTSRGQSSGPTPIMRQGRFLSPTSAGGATRHRGGGGGGGGYHPSSQQHHQYHQQQQHQQQHHRALASPTSQVRFDDETLSPNDAGREQGRRHHSPTFMFDEGEWSESDDDDDDGGGGRGGEDDDDGYDSDSDAPPPPMLPSETQLALLCLDHLRDLRRSYARRAAGGDGGIAMREAEGLDPDYLALAAWSLARAFVRPARLKHEDAVVSTIRIGGSGRDGQAEDVFPVIGGGGLGGLDDEPFGNDAWYRRLDEDAVDVASETRRRAAAASTKSVFELSERISLPSMEDITDEVLLRHPDEGPFAERDRKDDENDEEEDAPFYEHNDSHLSNVHRFYLLNGLASDSSATAVEGLVNPRGVVSPRSASTPQSSNTTTIRGSPLTMCEIASAGLAALRARPRIDADRGIVRNPLFGQFIDAASAGGFFQEKRSDERRRSFMADRNGALTAEEEALRSRLLYEEKYRKVVNKFRTKLATKEAQLISQRRGQDRSGPLSPYGSKFPGSPSSRSLNNAYRIMSGNASVSSAMSGGAGGELGAAVNVDAILGVGDVAERRRRRRERRMERARSQSTTERATEAAKAKHPPGLPAMDSAASGEEENSGSEEGTTNKGDTRRQQKEPQRTPASSPTREKPQPTVTKSSSLPLADSEDEDDRALYKEAENLNSVGNSLMQKKSFRKALATYTSAISLVPSGPNSHVYHSNRSAAYLSLKEYDSSVEDSLRSAELKPTYAKAHSRLGLAYFAMGRYGEAVDAYERSLEIDPENEWSRDHLRKALAVAESGTFDEDDEGKNDEAQLTSADDAEEDEDKEGEDEEKKVRPDEEIDQEEEDGNWPTPFDESSGREDVGADDEKEEGEASVPTKEENIEEEEEVEASETDEPVNAPAAPTAANAVEEKEKVLQADRHKDRGNAHMSEKEYEKALQQYDLAIASSPSGPNSHVYYSNRAAAYCYLARYDAASADCRRSVELDPMYEKAHARLGLSLFLRGEYGDAIIAYERSLELDPRNRASVSYLRKAKAKLAEVRLEQKKKSEEEEQKKKANVAESHRVVEEETHKASSSIERTGDHSSSFARARMARIMEEHRQRQQCNQQPIAEEEEEDEGSLGDETGITSTGLASIVTKDDDDNDDDEPHDENNDRELTLPAKERYYFPPSPSSQAFDPFDTTDD